MIKYIKNLLQRPSKRELMEEMVLHLRVIAGKEETTITVGNDGFSSDKYLKYLCEKCWREEIVEEEL